ncbi:MAG: hypothetical protein ACKOV8_06675, partial [Phycisphaerales bacterium]
GDQDYHDPLQEFRAYLHLAVARRMHIEDYERSVLRRIATLESVYGKVRDRRCRCARSSWSGSSSS